MRGHTAGMRYITAFFSSCLCASAYAAGRALDDAYEGGMVMEVGVWRWVVVLAFAAMGVLHMMGDERSSKLVIGPLMLVIAALGYFVPWLGIALAMAGVLVFLVANALSR